MIRLKRQQASCSIDDVGHIMGQNAWCAIVVENAKLKNGMQKIKKGQIPVNRISSIVLQTVRRFGQDLVGVLLICLALITALSSLGLTSGILASSWSEWFFKGFGWGSFGLLLLIAYVGVLILLRRIERFPKLNYQRIFSLELSLFSLVALLSMIFGASIERAHAGLDGGMIGWGIARLLQNATGKLPAILILSLIWIVSSMAGLGVLKPLGGKLDAYFNKLIEAEQEPALKEHLPGDEKVQPDNDQTDSLSKSAGEYSSPQTLHREYQLPPLDLLLDVKHTTTDEPFIHAKAIQIEKTLEEFGIPARVAGYRVGPTIIQYAVEPGYVEKVNEEGDIVKKKVRVSQISTLNRDLALALSVDRLRIEAPIPGHSYVGIEIPNTSSSLVRLKAILNSAEFKTKPARLNLALGLNVSGSPVIADLARMPHLLIAGTTGSGKSVCITSLIMCLAMNNSPDQLRMAILDPKMVEMLRFNGLPHLLGKVETQIERMLGVLAWAIKEMEDRYLKLETFNARDLDAYNAKMARKGDAPLPKIVIFIDELADLMMSASDQTEGYLVRLAQMARATGIHLVVATQRPSTDVITGLIKANFPARISFMTSSSVDSRVILDTNGAETLMGQGDLLFLDPETAGLKRAQGILIDDREIENVIGYWKNTAGHGRDEQSSIPWEDLVPMLSDDSDRLIEEAIQLVRREGHASTSRLQRKLRIGFPRAARLMDELEERGIVGPVESGGREREVLPYEESEHADMQDE